MLGYISPRTEPGMALRQRLSGRFFIEIAFLVLSSAILTAGYMVLLRFDDTTLTKRFVLKQIGVFADTGIPCRRHARDVPPSSSWPLIPTLRRLFPAHNDIHTISFRPALFRCRRQVSLTAHCQTFGATTPRSCAFPLLRHTHRTWFFSFQQHDASLHAIMHFPVDIPMHPPTPLARRQLFTRVHRCGPRSRCGFPVGQRCAPTLLASHFHKSTDNGARFPLKARRNVKNAGRRS